MANENMYHSLKIKKSQSEGKQKKNSMQCLFPKSMAMRFNKIKLHINW